MYIVVHADRQRERHTDRVREQEAHRQGWTDAARPRRGCQGDSPGSHFPQPCSLAQPGIGRQARQARQRSVPGSLAVWPAQKTQRAAASLLSLTYLGSTVLTPRQPDMQIHAASTDSLPAQSIRYVSTVITVRPRDMQIHAASTFMQPAQSIRHASTVIAIRQRGMHIHAARQP